MLTPRKLAEGAVGQIGATSTFATIYEMTTGAMDGNSYAMTPAFISVGQKVLATGKSLAEMDFTEAEARQALRLIPFSSIYGARTMLNYAANEMTN